ncbi:MAG TPA: ABC transporter substrate-binding protein [Candidatus Dormibacteraeota bacterium]|nr:ABC transporter substrate-binding protein [Candidatus Dormibacteraeota bacterium]
MKRFRLVVIALAACLAACGGTSGGTSSGSGPSKVASIASKVPSSVTSPVQIASDATYPPNEYIDTSSGAVVGWDIDFGKNICTVMGLSCNFNNVTFKDIIPQLTASTPRYQFSLSSFTPTSDRESKGIDFISYYKAGESWVVKASGGPSISSAADMCGKTVVVETGTTEESDAWGYIGKQPGGTAISGDKDNCTANGKQDIKVLSFDKQTDANTALLSDRGDVMWLDDPVAAYQVKQNPSKMKLSGKPCSVSPYGIALPKGSPLEQPMQDAVKYLIDNGYYSTLLSKWGVQAGAIKSSDVKINDNNSIGDTCVPSY